MICVAAMLAQAAAVQNGLLHIQGGGWESWVTPQFPAGVSGWFAAVLEYSAEEVGSLPVVTLEVADHEGHDAGFKASTIIELNRVPGAPPESPRRVPVAIPFALAVTQPGQFSVRLSDISGVLSSIDILVVQRRA